MGSFIGRLNRSDRKGRMRGGREVSRSSDLPLDHRLTFNADTDQKWSYKDEQILFNDVDVKEIVSESASDAGVLSGLLHGLAEYQDHVWGRGGKEFAKFNGTVASLQGTILWRMGSLYDGLTGGIHFECVGNDFWINNINVRSVLAFYRLRPTDKARHYLLMVWRKLDLILSRRHHSTRYDGINDRAKSLFLEVSKALEHIPPDAPLCLESHKRSA